MKLAVISDLHIGRKDITDRFGHEERHFHEFLDFLEAQADQIILLGDVIDTHHGLLPLAFEKELALINELYSGLTDRLLGGRYIVVRGNHDECLIQLACSWREIEIRTKKYKIWMTHGDRFDRLLQASRVLCAAGNWFAGMVQRTGLKHTLDAVDRFDDRVNGILRDRKLVYRDKALSEAHNRDCHVVVLGHIHEQDRYEKDGIVYLNSGACLSGRFEYVWLDTDVGEFQCRQWDSPSTV